MAHDGDRADAQALDQLEAILRQVVDELGSWRGRALKAESELKLAGGSGAGGASVKHDVEARNRVVELESENKALRLRVEAARLRVNDLLGRLTFLDDQVRESGGGGGNGASRAGGAASGGTGGGGGGGAR